MKKVLKKLGLLALVSVLLLTTACGGTSAPPTSDVSQAPEAGSTSATSNDNPSETVRVGFSISTLNNPFFVDLKDAAQEVADANGAELIVLDAGDNVTKQLSDVEDLVQQKVNVIIVNPTDSDAIVSAVEAANEAKIPVIAIDRSSNGGEIACYIASDNVKGGELAGQYIVDALEGKGKVVELEGIPGTSPARDRGKGFNDVMAQYPDIEILAAQPADFDRNKGLTLMENLLQAHPEIDALFAHNDEMALGAIEAIQASGRDIIVVGFDATDDGLQAIEEGTMHATIAEQSKLMGKTGMEVALQLAAGEQVASEMPLEVALVSNKG